MLKVKFKEVKGHDYRTCMEVHYNGEVIREEYDGGEPEDNSFFRDWAWIAGAIEEAYKLGLKDGRKNN